MPGFLGLKKLGLPDQSLAWLASKKACLYYAWLGLHEVNFRTEGGIDETNVLRLKEGSNTFGISFFFNRKKLAAWLANFVA